MNNRLFTRKVNLTKKMSERAEASSLCYVKSGLGGFSRLSVSPLALHLFSTMARRRISLISEEPFNWTSVGIMGPKSKWTQIGRRVNELSGRWNKNRLYLNSSGTPSLQLRLKFASTQKTRLWKAATFTLSLGQIFFFFLLLSPPLHWFTFKLGQFKQGLASLLVVFSSLEGENSEG